MRRGSSRRVRGVCGRRKRPTVAAVAKGKSLIGGGDDELVDNNCVSDLLLTKGGKSVMNQHSRRRTLRFASLFLGPPLMFTKTLLPLQLDQPLSQKTYVSVTMEREGGSRSSSRRLVAFMQLVAFFHLGRPFYGNRLAFPLNVFI
jgi:hypothetical protein